MTVLLAGEAASGGVHAEVARAGTGVPLSAARRASLPAGHGPDGISASAPALTMEAGDRRGRDCGRDCHADRNSGRAEGSARRGGALDCGAFRGPGNVVIPALRHCGSVPLTEGKGRPGVTQNKSLPETDHATLASGRSLSVIIVSSGATLQASSSR
jgi:hypothetical protein